jgi:hypothetical protein
LGLQRHLAKAAQDVPLRALKDGRLAKFHAHWASDQGENLARIHIDVKKEGGVEHEEQRNV